MRGHTNEPAELTSARTQLAQAETKLDTEEGLAHLQEGLELLEAVAEDPKAGRYRKVARQLGAAYASTVHAHVRAGLASGRPLPEPVLRHAFDLLRCFDGKGFDVPSTSRESKIELVRRLIDIYYEGYPAADKQRAYEELARITGVEGSG